jgi:hypothetical protein
MSQFVNKKGILKAMIEDTSKTKDFFNDNRLK